MMTDVSTRSWALNPGASEEDIRHFSAAVESVLPIDYLRFMSVHNGGCGFVGEEYLMLWPIQELMAVADAYLANIYAPGLVIIGSNGVGECCGFDMRQSPATVVSIPFVGMNWDLAKAADIDFSAILSSVRASDRSDEHAGMELFDVTPVICGGDPADRANKAWLNRTQHIEAVRYWNSAIADVRRAAIQLVQ